MIYRQWLSLLLGGIIIAGEAAMYTALAADSVAEAPAVGAPPQGNERHEGRSFDWSLSGKAAKDAQCREVWSFGKDAILTVESGEEIVTKRYFLSALENDPMSALLLTGLTTNGSPDCMGNRAAEVGGDRTIYLQFLNDGSFFTCGSTDGLSCYGVATARRDAAQ